MHIQLSRLDDGQGIAVTLLQHKARWYKTCYMRFIEDKVDRARKKVAKIENPEQESSPLKGRLRYAFPGTSCQTDEGMCFICDEKVEDLYHRAATARMGANVRKMAIELRDTRLLAKLS